MLVVVLALVNLMIAVRQEENRDRPLGVIQINRNSLL